jgi:hypothetical protein
LPSAIPGNAKIVGVELGKVFLDESFVSIYRGSEDIASFDLKETKKKFIRAFQGVRTDQLNGSWSSDPWYVRRGLSDTLGEDSRILHLTIFWVAHDS